ncbi:unnamed protein product [Cunninghamella echinulata]
MSPVICSFKNCNRSFSKLANFEKHVTRMHKDEYYPLEKNTIEDNKPIKNITSQPRDLEMDMDFNMNT